MRNKGGKRRSIPAKLLILAGAALQLAAVLMLLSVDPLLEFTMPAPDVRHIAATENRPAHLDTGLKPLIEAREDIEEQLGEAVTALSVSALRAGTEVSGNGTGARAALRAVDLRWLETCPRQLASGRWMDSGELKRGARVAVLDEDLAFALFGSEGAVGKEIEVAGARCEVIGTLHHRRGVGETEAFSAYIPLALADAQGVQLDVITMHALSAVSSGLEQSFADAMRSAWGAGEAHNLRKERMGALLMTRLLLFAFGMAALFRLLRRFAALVRRWRERIAALRARSYARRWLGPAALRGFAALLLAVLLLAAAYALLSFAIAPVYTFTEWVPESLVSLSALRAVFWDRTAAAARVLSVRTAESARIAFWGTLARTGAASLLLGLALVRKKFASLTEIGNQARENGV